MSKTYYLKPPSKHVFIRQIKARARLFISALIAICIWKFIPNSIIHQDTTRFIAAWDFGALFYLFLVLVMILRSTHEKMKSRALFEDEGQIIIMILVIISAVVSISAIIAELGVVKELNGTIKYMHLSLAIITILTSWLFTHTIFALHYAHDFYARISQKRPGGLEFPSTELPLYSDFIYFAYVVGTSGQTADVSFTSKRMRRIGTVHCVFAFFFNTTILALTINIASGLF